MNMQINYLGLGRQIRKRRKALHLTQDELATRAGISLSFLGHIERGSRKASIETLVSTAAALGTSPDSLLIDTYVPSCFANSPAHVRVAHCCPRSLH